MGDLNIVPIDAASRAAWSPPERYQPDASDLIYEEGLKRCRAEGHPRLFFFQVDGLEVALCPRCEARFVRED